MGSAASRWLGIAALLTLVLAGSAAAGQRSAPAEIMREGLTPEELAVQTAHLERTLRAEMPAAALDHPFVVNLTQAERSDLRRRQESRGGPAVVGRTKPVAEVVRFGPRSTRLGVLEAAADGGFTWAVLLRSEGAGAIRVHLRELDLPGNSELFFFSPAGQAFGPYSGRGPHGDGDFWSHTIFGSEGVLLLRVSGPVGPADLGRVSFVIADVAHIVPGFASSSAVESFCSFNAACVENASCHSGTPADPAKNAVALMQWVSGHFVYTCTGALLNDTLPANQIPYFLTANHCIDRDRDAQDLEFYFQFALACGSTSCPPQTQPGGIQRLGATLRVTGTGGDFTLLELNQAPPAGSVFLGWSNAPIANTQGAPLYRVSHPDWAPQAFSQHHVDTTALTCTGWPRGERIYSRDDDGATEGGSSGAPVLNGQGQVVGQLTGACGSNTGDPCDGVSHATVDGALAFYWPSVARYLDPGLTPSEVANLRWAAGAGKDQLDWDTAPSATSYIVYRGIPSDLPALLDAATDSCTRLTTSATSTGPTLAESPGAAGAPPFYWFLVTALNGVGESFAGSASAGDRIVNGAAACP